MNTKTPCRRVPTDDGAWLLAALANALDGGPAVQPIPPGGAPEPPGDLPANTALVIHTSGSSGIPKFVALSADALRASALATHEALGGPGQWLVTLPTHLIAGVQVLVRSILAGTAPVFAPRKFSVKKFLACINRLDHDRLYVSLVPAQLSHLLKAASEDRQARILLRRFDAVLVGGQAVPLALREQAHDMGIPLTRTYGMTETAGGAVYDGVEIGDARVRIRNGEVQLGGSMLAEGYIGDSELTNAAFITDAGARWFRTGDAGELTGGMLTVTGRIDRVLISGGVNVSLDEVERVAAETPEWLHAVAASAPSDEWGESVVLVTEVAELGDENADVENSFAKLRERIRATLGAASTPADYIVCDELPRLANGKPDHSVIQQLVLERVQGRVGAGKRGNGDTI